VTAAEVRTMCEERIRICGPGTHLVLVIPGKANRGRARLFGRHGGPSCTVVGETGPGRVCVDVLASEVLAWLDARGL
jgi:hypothetical protein